MGGRQPKLFTKQQGDGKTQQRTLRVNHASLTVTKKNKVFAFHRYL
jgi:hypothetical protein